MAKFTAGPWDIDGAKDNGHHYHEVIAPIATHHEATSEFNFVVADTLNRDSRISPDEDRSNTNLIAAAPEMYLALKDAEWGNNGHCPQCGMSRSNGEHQTHCILANALAKADGKAAL